MIITIETNDKDLIFKKHFIILLKLFTIKNGNLFQNSYPLLIILIKLINFKKCNMNKCHMK